MAIIYSYPKTAPLAADLLIVSRQPSDPDETANYSVSVSDIATLVTGLQQYTLKAGTKVGTSVPLTLDSDTGTDSTVNFTEGSNKPPNTCLLYTSPSPRDGLLSRMPSSA